MCKKSFTKRREILSKIPEGPYCYNPTVSPRSEVTLGFCPYWKSIGAYRAKCTLYNIKDTNKEDLLLWDHVKICQLKTLL